MSFLRTQQLYFSYTEQPILKDISFELRPQTISALIGPNGAGKTTLLNCLAALQLPSRGSIRLEGLNIHQHPRQAHQYIGYLTDDFGLYQALTVSQNLIHSAQMRGLQGQQCRQAVEQTIDQLALQVYRDQPTKHLSRGWKQRVGIGTAIVHQPKLLLLDEPASGLDPEARQSLSQLMCELRDQGMTLVVSSHILAELEDYCQDMLIIHDGKLIDSQAEKLNGRLLRLELIEDAQPFATRLACEKMLSNLSIKGTIADFLWQGDQQSQAELLKRLLTEGVPILSLSEQSDSMQKRYFSSISNHSHSSKS